MSSRTCLLLPKSIDFVQNGSSWSDSAIYKNFGLEKSKQICNNKYMKREHGVDEMKEFRMPKTLDMQGIEPNGGGGFKLRLRK